MTHAEACMAIAKWASGLRWCDCAVTEIAGVFTEPMPRGLNWKERQDWNSRPEHGGGRFDVLALTGVRVHEERQTRNSRKLPPPRIAVVEVKVQRSDLLKDLRAGKMRRYEPQASHVYLAIQADALLSWREGYPRPEAEMLAELDALGLPHGWGVIFLRPDTTYPNPWQARPASGDHQHAIEPTAEARAVWLERAAVSLAYRAMRA